MTRFVRIYHNPKDDPGSRIRVDYDPDDTGAFVIADENVLPEKTFDENCIRVTALGNVNLDRTSARWVRDVFIELCKHLDEEERAAEELTARAVVAAEHDVPLSRVHVVTGEVELSHRATAREIARAVDAASATTPPMSELARAATRCPYGNMPREAGAGHWRDWHRGHGCHLDPDHSKKGTP